MTYDPKAAAAALEAAGAMLDAPLAAHLTADAPKILEDARKCGHCGFPIHPAETQRYFGTYVAHAEYRCRDLMRGEITRLRGELDAARRPVSDEDVEAVARAISEAQDIDAYGSYDYSAYPGDAPPYVVRDERTGAAVFRSDNPEAATAEWSRLCQAFVARAALAAFMERR